MAARTKEQEAPWFLEGGGLTGALARSIDWSKTPLGSTSSWPESLRTTVATILHSRHPMFLWWGPELIQIYNDAYVPSFGSGKHPAAMGQPGRACWPEIWPIIGPQIESVMSDAAATWHEDQLVPIARNGRLEEVYWTYGYSPVFSEGSVAGTLVVVTETTTRVLAARRLCTIAHVAESLALARDRRQVLHRAAAALSGGASDVPFAVFYGYDRDSNEARVEAAVGVAAESLRALDQTLGQLRATDSVGPSELVELEQAGTLALPGGPWPEPATRVFIAPLSTPHRAGSRGFAVFGLSPRLSFDGAYRKHLLQLVDLIVVAQTRLEASELIETTERERNSLLMQAPVGTALMMGPAHVFTLANRLYCQMVGRQDLVGKTYLEAFPELASTELPGVLDRVYQTGEPFAANEYPVVLDRKGSGVFEQCYFKFSIEPMRDSAGSVYGLMAVAVDVTELVAGRHVLESAQRERERLLAELEQASRAKDEFLAMLGHELRNPLSPIVTALHLMQLRGDDAHLRERRVIDRQVKHLVRLVDDLLDVERITRGKVELQKAPLDVADVFARSVEMASFLLEKRKHRLTVQAPRGLWVDGDSVRLAQVFANLLTNAARYTEPGGLIELSAARENDEVVVRVKDNGGGIAAEMLPRLFELFVQGKRSKDRAEGGLGLGLALVKSLAQLHGGTVSAHSAGLGQGSEFTVRLPACPAPVSEVPPAEESRSKNATARRVLLVDDNADAAEMLAAALRSAGHDVVVAHEPVSALSVLDGFEPEVAVLDVGLPGMDGYELGARLRSHPRGRSCRLISLTGYGQQHDRERSRAAGFAAHLVKPVAFEQLLRALDEPRA